MTGRSAARGIGEGAIAERVIDEGGTTGREIGEGAIAMEPRRQGSGLSGEAAVGGSAAVGGWRRREFLTGLGGLWIGLPIAVGGLAAACGSQGERGSAGGSGSADTSAGAGSSGGGSAASEPVEAPSEAMQGSTSEEASAVAGGGEPAADAGTAPGPDARVDEIPAMADLAKAVQYQNPSPKPDQRCETCQLFTPTVDGVGHCRLFSQGLVQVDSWCTSWIQRVPTPG